MFFRITPIVSDRRLKSGRNLSGYYSEMNKAEVIKSCVERGITVYRLPVLWKVVRFCLSLACLAYESNHTRLP